MNRNLFDSFIRIIVGKRAEFCLAHKEADMIDVLNKKCACGLAQPRWNFQGLKSRYCSTCKLDGMIEPNRKMCGGCGLVRPTFNLAGLTAEFCNTCKTDGMVNVISKRCFCGKIISPCFNYAGLSGAYCFSCKLCDMVDVRSKKCEQNRISILLVKFLVFVVNVKQTKWLTQCIQNVLYAM